MAKGNRQPAKNPADHTGKPKSKRWLWIILLLVVIMAVGFVLAKYLYFDNAEKSFFDELKFSEKSLENIQVEREQNKLQKQIASEALTDSSMKSAVAEGKIPSPKTVKRHFIKVASCMFQQCQQDIQRQLREEKLSVYKKRFTIQTKYYELVSESTYNLRRAEKKIHILNKYNKQLGSASLVSFKDKYKISFGLFPRLENATRMKSHLAQLYPQVKIRFLIEPRVDHDSATNMYVGPFSKSLALKIKARLQRIPVFEFVEITTRP